MLAVAPAPLMAVTVAAGSAALTAFTTGGGEPDAEHVLGRQSLQSRL